MKVMLDTNICIALIKRKPPQVLKRFTAYKVGEIGISWVTLAELEFGVAKSRHLETNQAALDEFVLPLEIASFDREAARAYGRVRATLEKKRNSHRRIGRDDRGACPRPGRNARHQQHQGIFPHQGIDRRGLVG